MIKTLVNSRKFSLQILNIFRFEENFGGGGTILSEMRNNLCEALLNVNLAAKALFSSRGLSVFEPFPTFFLKQREIRTKRGFLDEI